MKSKLYNAMQTNDARTENGMPTNSTSGSDVLDLFFKMGGSRGLSESDIEALVSNAFNENPILTIKAMFYNRDVRGGQGERRSFRVMFRWLCTYHPEYASLVFPLVPEYGRWDDLLEGLSSDIAESIASYIYEALAAGNVLAKKWMPRENKAKKELAIRFMDMMNLTPVEYRNLISLDGDVVENYMCANAWDLINYNHVPSIASKNYRSAFGRHDTERYGEWLSKLEKGDKSVKINAGAILPSDIVKPYLYNRSGVDRTLEAQWKALPDFVNDGVSFIPVVDTSGSMQVENVWNVAYALGIYLGERNKSIFKDAFITFSENAQLISFKGATLKEKVNNIRKHEIVANTNFESVLRLILNKAVEAGLSEEDMPKFILVLSDMQFDSCVEQPSDSAWKMITRNYKSAGYKMPQFIFWNLRTSTGTPVKFDTHGTALVSGFSPSLMQQVLGGELTPMGMMMKILNSERYAPVEEALRG